VSGAAGLLGLPSEVGLGFGGRRRCSGLGTEQRREVLPAGGVVGVAGLVVLHEWSEELGEVTRSV
jgi:hypothetical protein